MRTRRRIAGLLILALSVAWAVGCREDPPEGAADPGGGAPVPQDPRVPGRFHEPRRDDGLTAEQRAEIERLESIGYTSASHPAPARQGVVVHDPERAWAGLNLYTSGHASEAVLMDMRGRVLHRWSYPLARAWPRLPRHPSLEDFWRRVLLLPNGHLIAIHEGVGILEVDARSRLVWRRANRAHHDLARLPDGSLYVLTRVARMLPRIDPELPVLEDRVTRLHPDGRDAGSFSLLEAMERSEWGEEVLAALGRGDIFHTNTLEVLDGSLAHHGPAFRPGNLLVSLLFPSGIGVVDPERRRFVWWRTGSWRWQHQPEALENGNILLLDNRGPELREGEKRSRVLEIDPASGEIVWSYAGDARNPFYTYDTGSVARLPNGNTLITESNVGRALEVTRDGEIVWEFLSPHRGGERDELIATLFEVVRLPAEFSIDWADGAGAD